MSRKQRRAQAKARGQRKVDRPGQRAGGVDEARLAAARGMLQSGLFAQGYAAYRSLIFDPPGSAALVPELVQLLFQRGALAEAEALATRASERFPADAAVWLQLGHARQKIGRADKAIEAYQRSLALEPGSAHAWAAIAQVHERLHRPDAALEAIDKAIALLPTSYPLAHCRGVILRRLGQADEAMRIQRGVLDDAPERDAAMRHAAWRELSLLHHAGGDTEASRRALASAKEAQAPLRAPYLNSFAGYQREVARRFAGFDADVAQAWSRDMTSHAEAPPTRHAFIVGHPRSGTTLTEQVLAAHRGVLTLDEREVLPHVEASVFNGPPTIDQLDRVSPQQRETLGQLYGAEAERYLGGSIGGRLLIDKRPDTLLMWPTLLRMMPASKVLVVIRDPRDVCASCYRQGFELGVISAQFHSIASACGYYAWFMSHWLLLRDLLPASMWLEVRYESLVSDCEGTARAVTDFLGLEWDDAVMSYQDLASQRLISTPSYTAVSQRPHTDAIGGWRAFAEEFEASKPVLRPYLDAFDYA
ncbi:MAG: sulfotransferase [Phycisphaerales bacterium JB063]